MDNIQIIAWIDRYLRGDLEADEEERFKNQYRDDPEFAKQVDLLREIRTFAGDKNLLELSRTVRKGLQDTEPVPDIKPSRTLTLPFFLTIAAAISFLVAAAYWFSQNSAKQSDAPIVNQTPEIQNQPPKTSTSDSAGTIIPQKPGEKTSPEPRNTYLALAETYYQSPVFFRDNIHRGDEDSMPATTMKQGYAQYAKALKIKGSDAKEAAKLLQQVVSLLATPPDSIAIMAHYLRGHARYQLKEFEAAAADFQFVYRVENMNSINAKWYRALCLLSINDKQKEPARQLLREIADGPPAAYKKQARELLVKIQSR